MKDIFLNMYCIKLFNINVKILHGTAVENDERVCEVFSVCDRFL